MISTGTGIAPFASLVRDPETYEKFEQIVLTHTLPRPCRAGLRPRSCSRGAANATR